MYACSHRMSDSFCSSLRAGGFAPSGAHFCGCTVWPCPSLLYPHLHTLFASSLPPRRHGSSTPSAPAAEPVRFDYGSGGLHCKLAAQPAAAWAPRQHLQLGSGLVQKTDLYWEHFAGESDVWFSKYSRRSTRASATCNSTASVAHARHLRSMVGKHACDSQPPAHFG